MPTQYRIGTSDPVIQNDPGAGLWNSKPKTQKMLLLKSEIEGHLPHAFLVIGDDAAKHLFHFFRNTGSDYAIDLEDMINDVPDAKRRYDDELEKAKRYVETLPVGTHNITTGSVSSGYNQKNESWNWYYAIGGYNYWIKGVATVLGFNSNGISTYRLEYEYKARDRYNWDQGKSVTIFSVEIKDAFMAEFHRQGLAKEFTMNGSIKAAIEWDSQSPYSHKMVSAPTGR
ncbi:MAG: hypothetical protein WAU91_16695 [Desulfatitalea sp.]